MNIRTTLVTSSLIAASLVSGSAHAALEGRDLNGSLDSFEAYYDTDLDITWLADANYAKTSGYDADGGMTWAAANTWVAKLTFVDAVNNLTYDNWRLPTTLQPDASCRDQRSGGYSYGYGCTGSEMGHLFDGELGGSPDESILFSTDPDLAKFTNLNSYYYWSGTRYAPDSRFAFQFSFAVGNQDAGFKSEALYAFAVTPGDVGAVPEADTWAMLLAGLALVGAATRQRRG